MDWKIWRTSISLRFHLFWINEWEHWDVTISYDRIVLIIIIIYILNAIQLYHSHQLHRSCIHSIKYGLKSNEFEWNDCLQCITKNSLKLKRIIQRMCVFRSKTIWKRRDKKYNGRKMKRKQRKEKNENNPIFQYFS